MLSLPTQQPSPTAFILDIALDNWSIFQQSFKLLCFTKFGVAGQQILSNRALPLTPFATALTKFDLNRTIAGVVIPDQFTAANNRSRSCLTRIQHGINIADRMWQQRTSG